MAAAASPVQPPSDCATARSNSPAASSNPAAISAQLSATACAPAGLAASVIALSASCGRVLGFMLGLGTCRPSSPAICGTLHLAPRGPDNLAGACGAADGRRPAAVGPAVARHA